jgi:hypothetical protein
MLTVTNPAGVRLAHLLETKAEDAVLRIFSRKRKFRLGVGHLRPDDRTFAHDGRVVLVLGARMSKSLAQHQLDIRETKKGPRLSLKSREKTSE